MGETKIEFQAQRYMQLKEEMKSLEERLEQTKSILETEMTRAGEHEVLVFYNAEKSIKVKLGETSRTKLDKDKMAEDLDVSTDSLKTKFLLKLVEDRRLTKEQYEEYEYEDRKNQLSIRLVNAE